MFWNRERGSVGGEARLVRPAPGGWRPRDTNATSYKKL